MSASAGHLHHVESVSRRQSPRMTPVETATYCALSLSTIHRALAAGELHGSQRVKCGKWSIRPECADAWLDGIDCAHRSATVVYLPGRSSAHKQ